MACYCLTAAGYCLRLPRQHLPAVLLPDCCQLLPWQRPPVVLLPAPHLARGRYARSIFKEMPWRVNLQAAGVALMSGRGKARELIVRCVHARSGKGTGAYSTVRARALPGAACSCAILTYTGRRMFHGTPKFTMCSTWVPASCAVQAYSTTSAAVCMMVPPCGT